MAYFAENKRSILIVDDEDSIRETLSDILSEEGYDVRATDGAQNALKEIEREEPHVIITDLRMSTSDEGIRLLQYIKNNYPYIQTIIMTGHGETETYLDARTYGAYGFLVKPFNVLVLKNMVSSAIRGGKTKNNKLALHGNINNITN